MEWLTDVNGNRCSVEYWGSKEAAQAALDSLRSCSDCSDCSGCSRCSNLEDAAPQKMASELKVPVIEDLHKKLYAAASQPKALQMNDWHTCENTHCRAGWVVALAGKEGRELEKFFNTELAAMKIYDASCPGFKINPVRFYDNNEAALEDMRKLAEAADATK